MYGILLFEVWEKNRMDIYAGRDSEQWLLHSIKREARIWGYYDLDEFTRQLDSINDFYDKNKINSCDYDRSSICRINPFKKEKDDHFYKYLNNLIKTESNGRDRNKLGSFRFSQVIYLSHEIS